MPPVTADASLGAGYLHTYVSGKGDGSVDSGGTDPNVPPVTAEGANGHALVGDVVLHVPVGGKGTILDFKLAAQSGSLSQHLTQPVPDSLCTSGTCTYIDDTGVAQPLSPVAFGITSKSKSVSLGTTVIFSSGLRAGLAVGKNWSNVEVGSATIYSPHLYNHSDQPIGGLFQGAEWLAMPSAGWQTADGNFTVDLIGAYSLTNKTWGVSLAPTLALIGNQNRTVQLELFGSLSISQASAMTVGRYVETVEDAEGNEIATGVENDVFVNILPGAQIVVGLDGRFDLMSLFK